jgi:hypothetical protein
MLTKEQINRAYGEMKFSTVHGVDGEPLLAVFPEAESSTTLAESLRAAFDALAAYERVAALAENYRTMTVLDDEDRKRNLRAADAIDRALEG